MISNDLDLCLNEVSLEIRDDRQLIREDALHHSQQRLLLALKGSRQGMWDWNMPNRSTYFDKSSCEVLGIKQHHVQILDSTWFSQIHPDDVKEAKRVFVEALRGDTTICETEYRVKCETGGWRWLQVRGSVVQWNCEGEPVRMTGTIQDITERKKTEEEVRLYATVFKHTHDGVAILNQHFAVQAVNQACADITGYDNNDLDGFSSSFVKSGRNPANLQQLLQDSIQEQGHWKGEVWGRRKDGGHYPMAMTISGVFGKNGMLTHYVAVFSDITKRRQTERDLRFLANHDPLTKLPNRGKFRDRLSQTLHEAKRYKRPFAILFIDLNNFKQVNDTYGHSTGDELLRVVATRLKEAVRQTDFVARLAGDEFVTILDGIKSDCDAKRIATKILHIVGEGAPINNGVVTVGASIGISLYPNDATELDALIHRADTAMYSAKALGGNNLKFYKSNMSEVRSLKRQLENDIGHTVSRQELFLVYQPKINTETLRIVGFEALVRWQHPELGVISPGDFIPVAEESGFIRPIGEWVFREACRQLKAWQSRFCSTLRMAINVSPRQFQLSDFPLYVAKVINEESVAPQDLDLELTEGCIMEDPEMVLLMLRVLKNLGFKLSVDDFGTGYSSLGYLQKFPVDTLKIDRSFIAEIDEREDSRTLVTAIFALARSLNLDVVAEGVESEVQLECLQNLNCEQLQGYWFSAPVMPEEAERLLQSWGTVRASGDEERLAAFECSGD